MVGIYHIWHYCVGRNRNGSTCDKNYHKGNEIEKFNKRSKADTNHLH